MAATSLAAARIVALPATAARVRDRRRDRSSRAFASRPDDDEAPSSPSSSPSIISGSRSQSVSNMQSELKEPFVRVELYSLQGVCESEPNPSAKNPMSAKTQFSCPEMF